MRMATWAMIAMFAAGVAALPADMQTAADLRVQNATAGMPAGLADTPQIAAYGATQRPVPRLRAGLASSYGPGLYGNHMACGGVLHPDTVAVAHRSLPCGAVLVVCHARRCATMPVRDRGPFVGSRTHDLSVGAVRRLGVSSAASWGVRSIRWRCVRRCR